MELGLRGKVVAMATAVQMENLSQASLSGTGAEVTCFATVGCGNALSAGDPASVMPERAAHPALHTINIITVVEPGLSEAAMVEAVQIATEGRVRVSMKPGFGNSVLFSCTRKFSSAHATPSPRRRLFRVAVRHRKDNRRLLAALHEWTRLK